jgi:hypothetical protein
MDFTYLDHKEVVQWEDLLFHSIKIKKELFLQDLQIKDSYLFVIGPQDPLIKQEVKTIQSYHIGINKETTDLLSLWIYFHQINK